MAAQIEVETTCRFFTGKLNRKYQGVFLLNSRCQMVHLGSGDIFDRGPEVLNYQEINPGDLLKIVYPPEKGGREIKE